jgi:cell division protein FtsW (lipid II flippase)
MDKRFTDRLDWTLISFTGIIVLAGLFNLYSATYNLPVAKYFNNQMIWMSLGIGVAIVLSFINYTIFDRLALPLYANPSFSMPACNKSDN